MSIEKSHKQVIIEQYAVKPGDTGSPEVQVALLTDRIDEALLSRTPHLKIVANVAVGVDNIDLAACATHKS